MEIIYIVWGGLSVEAHVEPAPPPHVFFFFFIPYVLSDRKQEEHVWKASGYYPPDRYRREIQFLLVAAHVEHAWVSIFRDNDTQTQWTPPPSPSTIMCCLRSLKALSMPQLTLQSWNQVDLICAIMKSDVLHEEGQICRQARQRWAFAHTVFLCVFPGIPACLRVCI